MAKFTPEEEKDMAKRWVANTLKELTNTVEVLTTLIGQTHDMKLFGKLEEARRHAKGLLKEAQKPDFKSPWYKPEEKEDK